MARAKKVALDELEPTPETEPVVETETVVEDPETETPEDPGTEETEPPVTVSPFTKYVLGSKVGVYPPMTFQTHHVGQELEVLKNLYVIIYCMTYGLVPQLVTVTVP